MDIIYLDDITGTIGEWLDAIFDCGVPNEVVELLRKAYELSVKEYDTSFDVDVEKSLVPNGTKVKFADGKIGIVDGNDEEETEDFEDINYYVCPIEFTNEEYWSNHYVMLLRNEFEIVKD